MATAVAAAKGPKEITFSWEGKDKAGKTIRGEVRAVSEAAVNATLRRQGILVQKVKAVKRKGGGKVGSKDIALFTRQLATMMKAGVPLLQSFEIVSKGASNPAVAKLPADAQASFVKGIAAALEKEGVAYDIDAYRDAPPGLRIWCGATVDTADIEALGPWLDWAWEQYR